MTSMRWSRACVTSAESGSGSGQRRRVRRLMTDASDYPGRKDMAANVHPTSGELAIAARDPARAVATLDHVDDCVACRVRLARISRDRGFEPPDDDSLQRVLAASSLLPDGLGELIRAERDGDP